VSDLGAERRLDSLSHWTARTASVLTAFPSWSAEVRCLDLTEEVGELARAVLVAEGRKSTDLEEPVAHALCGVLFDVFALAELCLPSSPRDGRPVGQWLRAWSPRDAHAPESPGCGAGRAFYYDR